MDTLEDKTAAVRKGLARAIRQRPERMTVRGTGGDFLSIKTISWAPIVQTSEPGDAKAMEIARAAGRRAVHKYGETLERLAG